MCKALNLTANAYYQLARKEKQEIKKEQEKVTVEKVRDIFEMAKRTYGYRRMQRALAEEGFELSEHKIRKIMRESGLYPVATVKYKPARRGKATGNYFENVVNQNFKPRGFNEIWVGDITYIKTCLGWVYLAVVLDLYNKEVIGYSVSKTIDAELEKRALSNALVNTGGGGRTTIFHSDRGIQVRQEVA